MAGIGKYLRDKVVGVAVVWVLAYSSSEVYQILIVAEFKCHSGPFPFNFQDFGVLFDVI